MFEGIYRLVSTWKCSAALSVLPTHKRYISLVIASRRFPCPYPEGKVVFRSCCPTFLLRDSRINEGAEKRIEKRTNEDGGGNMARQGWKSKTCVLHASTFTPSSHRHPTFRPLVGSQSEEDCYAIDLSCVGYGAVPHLYLRLTLSIHDIIGTNCVLSPCSLTFLPLLPLL